MTKYYITTEIKKVSILKWFVAFLFILIFPAIKVYLTYYGGFAFYRQVEIFTTTNAGIVPLLFPMIMTFICLTSLKDGTPKGDYQPYNKNEYIELTKAKLTVNGILSFIVAFSIVFLPFLFEFYILPSFHKVTLYTYLGNPIPYTTFDQLLSLGKLPYGLIYSFWVGINGSLYATFGLILFLIYKNSFISYLIPFACYLLGHYYSQQFGYKQFSPLSSIFPYDIAQQPLCTVLIPFTVLSLINVFLFKKLIRQKKNV